MFQNTRIEQVPELQHNEESEEDCKALYRHTAFFIVKPEQHAHKQCRENHSHAKYIIPHGFGYNEIRTFAGFSFITLSLGGIDAKAKAAKVSIIRFTHSICVTVNGNSVPTSEPNSTMNSATKLIVNWNTMKRWIFLYNERPTSRPYRYC